MGRPTAGVISEYEYIIIIMKGAAMEKILYLEIEKSCGEKAMIGTVNPIESALNLL